MTAAETSSVSAGTVRSQGEAVHTCRRCGQHYLLEPTDRWAACPSCGAGAGSRGLKSNGNAAFVSLLALAVLVVGINVPFVEMRQLGEVRIFSLLGGIGELWRRGNAFLAGLLLVFSAMFPIAKLLAILVATSRLAPLSGRARGRLCRVAAATARYSMLDIFVVALMVVLVKLDGIASVSARAGTLLFCAAVLLSIVAGFLVDSRRWTPTPTPPATPTTPLGGNHE